MKKSIFSVAVLLTAFSLLISCGKCDKNDPNSDCYVPDPATTDAGVVINGVKWATRNIDKPGTFAATPESAGMFYQWNRKVGWSASDPLISSNNVTEWDTTMPEGTEWTKTNDPCPAGWCVPTHEQQLTLLDTTKVSNVWTTQKGTNGRLFTDKATGKTLFLPAVGCRSGLDGALYVVSTTGYYWSSTRFSETSAYVLYFGSGGADWYYGNRRDCQSVRAVAE